MNEMFFEVREDDVDGGYTASALGYGIHTEGESVAELQANVREAVACYFDRPEQCPKLIGWARSRASSRASRRIIA